MKKCNTWPIGFCSWSLQNNFDDIDRLMSDLDIEHIHLDLRPCCIDGSEEYLQKVKERNWTISSTMIGFPQEDYTTLDSIRLTGGIVPDECWKKNQQIFLNAIETTQALGVTYLSAHFGFIDHSDPSKYHVLLDRTRMLADHARQRQVVLLLETGQESATDLERFLLDLNHPAIGINFDPANMILYNQGNPCDALKELNRWVRHIHIKDAVLTETRGTWGAEVPWGTGQVNPESFVTTLKEINYNGCLAIEREAGATRIEDVTDAIKKLMMF